MRKRNSMKCCANIEKSATETTTMISQAFGGRKHQLYMESPNSQRKKARQVKSKVGMLIIFFDIKEIVHKEFVLAGQTVNSACYSGV
jgi:hypothetical protein